MRLSLLRCRDNWRNHSSIRIMYRKMINRCYRILRSYGTFDFLGGGIDGRLCWIILVLRVVLRITCCLWVVRIGIGRRYFSCITSSDNSTSRLFCINRLRRSESLVFYFMAVGLAGRLASADGPHKTRPWGNTGIGTKDLNMANQSLTTLSTKSVHLS